jgi:hypothetical protein
VCVENLDSTILVMKTAENKSGFDRAVGLNPFTAPSRLGQSRLIKDQLRPVTPAAQQFPQPVARMCGGEVSWDSLSRQRLHHRLDLRRLTFRVLFFAALRADLSTKKSSRLAPALIAAVNHLGCAPLPAQTFPDLS